MNTPTLRPRFPRAFSPERLAALLAIAADLTGVMKLPGGIVHESAWWRAFILVGWDTGFRPDQMFSLDRRWILPSGEIPIDVHLTPETMAAVGAICSAERTVVFSLPAAEDYDFAGRWKLIRSFADLERKGGGK